MILEIPLSSNFVLCLSLSGDIGGFIAPSPSNSLMLFLDRFIASSFTGTSSKTDWGTAGPGVVVSSVLENGSS